MSETDSILNDLHKNDDGIIGLILRTMGDRVEAVEVEVRGGNACVRKTIRLRCDHPATAAA